MEEDRVNRSDPRLAPGSDGGGGHLPDALKIGTYLTSREPMAPVED